MSMKASAKPTLNNKNTDTISNSDYSFDSQLSKNYQLQVVSKSIANKDLRQKNHSLEPTHNSSINTAALEYENIYNLKQNSVLGWVQGIRDDCRSNEVQESKPTKGKDSDRLSNREKSIKKSKLKHRRTPLLNPKNEISSLKQ